MCELNKRGMITAQICSDPFVRLGISQARTFGVPDLPIVIIPHPLGGLTVAKVEERARVALSQIVRLIEESRK